MAHVEAGIRSGDLSMPEEINRIATDALTDFFSRRVRPRMPSSDVAGSGKKGSFSRETR